MSTPNFVGLAISLPFRQTRVVWSPRDALHPGVQTGYAGINHLPGAMILN